MRVKNERAMWGVTLLTILAMSAAAQAQSDPRQQATGRFEAAAPAIGERLPDLTVHDASGKAQQLGELLQGHYTVIVLGCLT